MNTITIDIPETMMQRLQARNQPLQSLLLEALHQYINQDSSLENSSDLISGSDGQKMADALKQIALNHSLSDINPQDWQREIRQDRQMPNRD
ncbi:MAG: hypothetical protein WBB82_03325 [Limnothrix sp.]